MWIIAGDRQTGLIRRNEGGTVERVGRRQHRQRGSRRKEVEEISSYVHKKNMGLSGVAQSRLRVKSKGRGILSLL